MNPENEIPRSGYEKTEQIVNAMGEHVGHWAGRVLRRMQHAAGALNAEADKMDTPVGEAGSQGQEVEHSTMRRAEELMGKAGEYLKHVTTSNPQVRRTLARLKEDMEDMWVEAHNVERHLHTPPRQERPQDETH